MNYILAAIAVLFITSCEKPKPKEARPQTSNQVKPEPAPESKPITMAYITGEDVQLATVSEEGLVAGQKLELDLKPIALQEGGIYLDNQRIGQVDFQEADIPRYSGPGLAFSFVED